MVQQQDFDHLQPDRREQLLAWLTPSRKIAIVGGITLIPALTIGYVLNSFFPSSTAHPEPTVPKIAVAPSTPENAMSQTSQEVDRLKAEVALSDQRQMLERLQTKKAPLPRHSDPLPIQSPIRPVLPRPATLPRVWPLAEENSSSLPIPRPTTVTIASTRKLTRLTDERPSPPILPKPITAVTSRLASLIDEKPVRSSITSLDPNLDSRTTAISPMQSLNLSVTRKKAIPATTLAVGVLERPILIEQGAGESERYLVILTEAVADETGEVLLPAGTRVLVVIQRVSANGLVHMKAVSLRQQGREILLQSTSVRGLGGLPLQANSRDKGNEIASLDLGQSLLKGAEDGLNILNRATSSTQSSGAGGSYSTSSYGPVNGLAAIGSGFFGELGHSIRQRNQLAVKQIQERPNLWLLPGGTPVELLFGQEISL